MNTLHIDTTDNKKTIVKITGEKSDVVEHSSSDHKSQVALILIDKILRKNKISLGDISEIQVNTGPGSYTGIRVGIAIAQALSFAKNISINGKPLEKYPNPTYS